VPFYAIVVGTTPTQLAGTKLGRKSISLFNNSAQDVFVSQDRDGITTKGFVLKAGAAISLDVVDGDEPHQALYAQVSAGTSDVRVQTGEAQ